MFRCRACAAKDSHIADLQKQVAMLRAMALPEADPLRIPFSTREADALLSASDEPISVTASEELREVNALLTGSYDNAQVEIE